MRAERREAKGVLLDRGVESDPLRVVAPRREDSAAADRGERGRMLQPRGDNQRMLQPRGGRLDGAVRAPPLGLGLGLGLGLRSWVRVRVRVRVLTLTLTPT